LDKPPSSDSAPETPSSSVPEKPSVLTRIADVVFPVRAGPVPPWSRVVTLIFMMTLVWELLWLGTYAASDPNHDIIKAWGQASNMLPFAALFATLGAVPGYWLMRRRVQAVNERTGYDPARKTEKSAAPRTPRATEHASSRARRRHTSKKRVHR
jgi:hypothetical protein